MYQKIWKDYKTRFYKTYPRLPREKSFSVGRALWSVSRQKRIKFIEIAQKTGLDQGTILRMSASHKLTSSPERVKLLADALGVDLREFFRAAREEFFGNFFITKAIMPSEKEVREYARQGLFLIKQEILKCPDEKNPDFRVVIYTPPVESLDDFFSASILLSPGKAFTGVLPRKTTVHLAVMNGSVRITSDVTKENYTAVAGQAILFNGSVKHSITNLSNDRESEILISFMPTRILALDTKKEACLMRDLKLDMPVLLEKARRWLSPDPETPVPLSEVALRAGLEPRDLDPLLKGRLSNFPLEKLEALAEALHIPMEDFFIGAPFHSGLDGEITTGTERGAYDYRARFGVTLYPWIKMGAERKKLIIGQAAFDTQTAPQNTASADLKQKIWEGKNRGYFLAKGLSGKIGIQAGERHYYPNIDREDTIYFDMNLRYSLQSLAPAEPTSFFFVSNSNLF